jgi:hypothetical protein
MVKQLAAGLISGLLLGFLGWLLANYNPLYAAAFIIPAGPLAALVTWGLLPRISKVTATAEERNGVTILLYTHDDRLLPLAGEYDPERHIIRPTGRLRSSLVIFPDPESTMSLYGHRQKLALVHVDQPAAISPKYLAIVYDLKFKYQAETLGVALDMDRAARKGIDELERDLQDTEQLLALVESAISGDQQALQSLAQRLGRDAEELDEHVLEQLRETLVKRREMLETAISLAKRYGKPVAFVGGRVYTVRHLLGYLAFRIRNSSLRMIKELARLEVLERRGRTLSEVLPWITIIILAIIALAAISIIMGHGGGVHAPSMPHLPTKTIALPSNTSAG